MNKEQAYDAEIAPLMTRIIEAAREHGIAMFASFDIPNDEDPDLRCTTHLPDGCGEFSPRLARLMADTMRDTSPIVAAFTITKA